VQLRHAKEDLQEQKLRVRVAESMLLTQSIVGSHRGVLQAHASKV